MNKRILIVIILALLGIGLIAYPSVSNYLSEINGSQAIRDYSNQVAASDPDELAAALKDAEIYNQNLTGSPVHDPFLEGTGMAMPEYYAQVLNIGGVMGYVDIPKINVHLPIYHGTSEEVLRQGIGHLEGSTLPIGGASRHSVLTGHSGLVSAKLFTDLIELEEGDIFYIYILDEILAYQVDQIKVIEPNVTDDLRRIEGGDYCTLLTCTPYGVNTHRLLVRGSRIEYTAEQHESIQSGAQSRADNFVRFVLLITLEIALNIVLIIFLTTRRSRRKGNGSSGKASGGGDQARGSQARGGGRNANHRPAGARKVSDSGIVIVSSGNNMKINPWADEDYA